MASKPAKYHTPVRIAPREEREHGMTDRQLAFAGPNGIEMVSFNQQPSTNDIAQWKPGWATHVVQQISGRYEVYDLSTLRQFVGSEYTIGVPVAYHDDIDAALMLAALTGSLTLLTK